MKMSIDLANEMAARTEMENVELRAEIGRLRSERDTLRAIAEKSIETIEWQRREKEVLRELVREAMDVHIKRGYWSIDWLERADKALGN